MSDMLVCVCVSDSVRRGYRSSVVSSCSRVGRRELALGGRAEIGIYLMVKMEMLLEAKPHNRIRTRNNSRPK
jgi:hypothetical protein